MTTTGSATPTPPTRYYARVSRRVQATLIDGGLFIASPAILLLLASLTDGSPFAVRVLTTAWLASFFLYEPVLVSLRGATIGHAWANIRIVDARTGGRPPFWRAFVRFLVKMVLGVFSFACVVCTRRHQAAHDLAAGTTVEVRRLWRMLPGDYLTERIPDPTEEAAPRVRRLLVMTAYSLATLALVSIALAATQSERCLVQERCTPAERASSWLVVLVWLALQVICLAAGLSGRLPGARPRRVESEGADPSSRAARGALGS
jgi:uncharacterized RDD family membrane protein YckC